MTELKEVQTDRGTLRYYDEGTGPVVLFLHGSGPGVTGWRNFRGILPTFAAHFRCLILEFPGFGVSDDFGGHPMIDAQSAVVPFLDALGVEKVDIVGNSMGGGVGINFAINNPDRIGKLVTIGGIGTNIFSPGPSEGIRLLQEFTERDLGRLADMLVNAADGFIAVGGRRPPDEPIVTSNGLPMTVPIMTSAMLGEQLIHGLDIARAVGAAWPISRADALRVIAGVMAMVPDYVDRQQAAGLHAAYELRFRGGPRYRMTIDDGTAAVGPATGQADC